VTNNQGEYKEINSAEYKGTAEEAKTSGEKSSGNMTGQ